jgi:hypothetical protein
MQATAISGGEIEGAKTPQIVAIIGRLVDPETKGCITGERRLTFAFAKQRCSVANQLPKTLPF